MSSRARRGFAKELERRVLENLRRYQPDNPRLKRALLLIGMKVMNEAKRQIRRQRLIDTGSLLNSIQYRLFKQGDQQGVEIGSYGIPYARVWEFGFSGPQTIRTHSRTITQVFGNPIEAKTITVAQHVRQVTRNPRPYLRPAIRKVSNEIVRIIKDI
jgi:hypothetical protein